MKKIVAYVGNDVHQAFIEATVYRADEQVPIIEKRLLNKKINVQKFYKKLSNKYEIRATQMNELPILHLHTLTEKSTGYFLYFLRSDLSANFSDL